MNYDALMLQRRRLFYLFYPQVRPEISVPLASKSPTSAPRQPRPLPAHLLLRLSWTHLVDLIALDDPGNAPSTRTNA